MVKELWDIKTGIPTINLSDINEPINAHGIIGWGRSFNNIVLRPKAAYNSLGNSCSHEKRAKILKHY